MRDDRTVHVSEWTVDTLCAHLVAIIAANDKRYEQRFTDSKTAVDAALNAAKTAVDAALSAAKEAVQKAEGASEKRFEGVNEFRATLADQQRTLMPRSEAELRMRALELQVDTLNKITAERGGQKVGAMSLWAWIAAVIGIGFGLISIYRK